MPVFLALRLSGGSRDRWIAMLWSRIALVCLGLRWRRLGRPLRNGLLAANHVTWIDPLAIGAVALAFFVAKREVSSWPVVGLVCRLGRVEFVTRLRSDAHRQARVLGERIDRKQLLCMFPEGTSTDGLRMLPFRSTLFEAVCGCEEETLVQPVAMHYRPPSGLSERFYGWWGDAGFVESLWHVLVRSKGGVVTVSFLPSIAGKAHADRKELAQRCEEAVRAEVERLHREGGIQPNVAVRTG